MPAQGSPRKPKSPRSPRGTAVTCKSAVADWESASGSSADGGRKQQQQRGRPHSSGKRDKGRKLPIADEDVELDAEEPSSEDVSRWAQGFSQAAVLLFPLRFLPIARENVEVDAEEPSSEDVSR